MRLVRQSATMQLVSIHFIMSAWTEPISCRNSPSGVSQTIWRSADRSILSLLSLHFVNVTSRRWSLSELQSTIHTLRMKRAAWHSQSQDGTESHGLFDSVWEDGRLRFNEMHFRTVFAERVKTSEESHPSFLPSEGRLVSEADVGDGNHLHFSQVESSLLKNRLSSGAAVC